MARRNPDNSHEPAPLAVARAPRWQPLLAAAVIALAAIVVYRNSFTGVFTLDDSAWISDNASIKQLWPIWPVLFPAKAEFVGGRPVVSLTLAINYALATKDAAQQPEVWGFHAVNLAIHILAAWTLFGLIRRTLLLSLRFASAATGLAFAAALLWTVHPLQTGAVTYIIQRMESLVSLFYLLTLYCVLRGATSSPEASSTTTATTATPGAGTSSWLARAWYVAAALACALGMATKEVMATAPLVVLLYDRTFLSGSFRKALAKRWGLYLALAASWGIVVWVLLATNFHGRSTATENGQFTPWTYLLTQAPVLTHYLRLAFWPAGQCFDYGWAPAESLRQVIWPGLFIVALLGLTVLALVMRPALGFLGASFFLILAPTSSFVPILDAAVEHRIYLPLAAIAVGVVLAVYVIFERFVVPRAKSNAVWLVPAAALAAATVALGWATVRRNELFRSNLVLWQDVVEKRPNNPRGHVSLGLALHTEKRDPEAIEQYNQAIQIGARSAAHHQLANLLLEYRQFEQARAEYKLAEQLQPHDAEIQFCLGYISRIDGNVPEAVKRWRAAVRLDPDKTEYLYGLAWVLATNQDASVRNGAEAVELAQRGVRLTDGKDPAMLDALAAAQAETGQFSQAVQTARQALELASQLKNAKVANAVQIQLHNYESGLPYREPQ